MNDKNMHRFLEAITPTIERLASQWFSPDLKSPEGHHYACTYCTMNFSQHDKHDDDCWIELARRVRAEWTWIDQDPKYLRSPIKPDFAPRPPEQVKSMRDWQKASFALRNFFGNPDVLLHLVPWDSNDPVNQGIVCTSCGAQAQPHAADCASQILAQAMSDLMSTKWEAN